MTEETLAECFVFLSMMNCGSEQRWTDALRSVYEIVLRPLDDEIGRRAVNWAVRNEDWRPSPARLLKISSREASPVPGNDDAWKEVVCKLRDFGMYARPVPEHPAIRIEGPPPFTHPAIDRAVFNLGDVSWWTSLCTSDLTKLGVFIRQFRDAMDEAREDWQQEVQSQLALPPAQRDVIYRIGLDPYPRFIAPSGKAALTSLALGAAPLELEGPERLEGETQIPDWLKEQLAGIGTMPQMEQLEVAQ